MEVFDTIIILKEMGMPLNEIKEFMDHRSPESLMELFEKEDKKITEQIKRLKYQQQFIRGRICVSSHSMRKTILRDYEAAGLPESELIFDWACPEGKSTVSLRMETF
jgi:DNA-binding transcriptional MerR regulator